MKQRLSQRGQTSQTIMASWLVPFLPCWVKSEATSLDPFKNIRPTILWSCSSLRSKEEVRDPGGLLREFFLFLIPRLMVVGEFGRGFLLSAEKQDPILRALIMLNMHSRPASETNTRFSIEGSVADPLQTPNFVLGIKNFKPQKQNSLEVNEELLFLQFWTYPIGIKLQRPWNQ